MIQYDYPDCLFSETFSKEEDFPLRKMTTKYILYFLVSKTKSKQINDFLKSQDSQVTIKKLKDKGVELEMQKKQRQVNPYMISWSSCSIRFDS